MSSYLFNRYTLLSVGVVVGIAYYYNQSQNNTIRVPFRPHILFGDMRRSAVVIGATGATGTSLVQQLLKSKEWGKVTIIHRRLLDVSMMELTEEQSSKLHQHTVDMNDLTNEQNIKLFSNHDVTFCTLGTTRDIAKTAEKFRQVDIGMVRDSAIASKKANIRQFNLLTSSGANANMPANDWKLFHGLLYLKTKGQIENIVKDIGFERTSIFRPGLLDRGKRARWIEQIMYRIVPSTTVQDVAKAMIYDAESTEVQNDKIEQAVVYEERDIKQLVKLD